MGYLENYLDWEKSLQKNAITNGGFVKNAVTGWDVSSLDYDAPGIEGWTNRLIGLSTPINPKVWADTIAGVVKNNSLKNPDANFLESSWENFIGVTGGALGGVFRGIALPAPVIKATALSIGSGLDELTDAITGKSDTQSLSDKLKNSWDLSKIDSWELGNGLDRGNLGIGDISTFILGDMASVFLGNVSKEELKAWGGEFIDSSFDIFDPTQKDKLQSHFLNPLQQVVNFVGEWTLDLTSFVPGGALAKGARVGLKGIAGSELDYIRLQKASLGEATAYDSTLDFFASTTNVQEVFNGLTKLGVTDNKVNFMSKLITDAKSKQEVADVFLAAEYRDSFATLRLFSRLKPEEKYWGLSLDGLNQGGTYSRTLRDGTKVDKEFLTADDFNAEFLLVLDSYIDQARKLDIDNMPSAMTKELENFKEIVSDLSPDGRVITRTAAPLRDYGLKLNSLDRQLIRWKSNLLEDNDFWKKIEYRSDLSVAPAIVRIIRKAPLTSHKGFLDFNNVSIATQKLMSKLNELDSISKGDFAKTGELQRIVDRLFNSTSPSDLRLLADEIETAGLKIIAKKHTKSLDKVEAYIPQMLEGAKISQKHVEEILRFNRKLYDPKENKVMMGEVTGDITDVLSIDADTFFGIDFGQLDSYIKNSGTNIEKLIDASIGAKDFVQKINRFFMAAVLTRPARLPRERLANLPGLILGGNFYDIFLSKNTKDAIYNVFYNGPAKARRLIDNLQVKQELGIGSTANLGKEMRRIDSSLELYNKLQRSMREMSDELANSNLADEAAKNRSPEEQRVFAEISVKRTEKDNVIISESADGVITVSDELGIRVYANTDEALKDPRYNANVERFEKSEPNEEFVLRKNEVEEALADLNKKKKDLETKLGKVNSGKNVPKTDEEIDALTAISAKDKQVLQTNLNSGIEGLQLIAIRSKNITLAELKKLSNNPNPNIASAAKQAIVEKRNKINGKLKSSEEIQAEIQTINFDIEANKAELDDLNIELKSSSASPTIAKIKEELAAQGGQVIVRVAGSSGRWSKISIDELENIGDSVADMQYRIVNEGWNEPTTTVIKSYGETKNIDELELTPEQLDAAGFRTIEDFRNHFKSGGAGLNECRRGGDIFSMLAAAGIGGLSYIDNITNEAVTILNPKLTKTPGFDPVPDMVQRKMDEYAAQSPAQRRVENNYDLSKKETLDELDVEAEQILNEINGVSQASNPEGYLNFLNKYKDVESRYNAVARQLQSRRNKVANIVEQERKGLKPRISEGTKNYKGQQYDNYGEGIDGKYAMAAIHPRDTWLEVYGMNRIAAATYEQSGGARLADLLPGDRAYYDGLASWLQLYGRNDPVFTMLAEGKSKAEVLGWLRDTSAGKTYARKYNIDRNADRADRIAKANKPEEIGYAQNYEDYIDDRIEFIQDQLFDEDLKALFFSGERMTGSDIADIFKGREFELKPIRGRIINPGEVRRATGVFGKFIQDFNRLVVENPQQFLENVPMATAHYNETMQNLIDANIAKYGRDLSLAEINVLQQRARKDSERHVRKWLYNVQTKSNFVEAVSTFVPFLTAYTFTIKQLMRGFQDNPAAALWLASGINKMSYDPNWIDSEGNPSNLFEAQSLVIPLDENIANLIKGTPMGALIGDANEIRLSTRSLNVWFGGEVIPGPGPLISIPVSEFTKADTATAMRINEITKKFLPIIPGGDGLIDYILPFGPGDKFASLNQLLPTWANNVIDQNLFGRLFNSDYRGQQYLDAYAKVMAHESAKRRVMGENYTLPTEEEISSQVDALYGLKFLSAFVSPVAFQVRTEADLARQTYKQYKDKYADQADWKFLTDHPELISGMVTATSNEFGLSPDQITVNNLADNKEVVNTFLGAGEGGRDMLGFFMNTSGQSEFDDLAYTALQNQAPGIGEANYYGKISPAEVARKAASKAGWIYFNTFMSALDAEALEKGINPDDNIEMSQYKSQFLNSLQTQYPEWAQEYMTRDAFKFTDRAITIEKLLSNPEFTSGIGSEIAPALALFIDTRTSLVETLQQRRATGGSGSIASESNSDLRNMYNNTIYQLKAESIRFSEFYNRFFERDSLTS
jgi:hypothetical protein